jgi:hypothetical protein
MRLSFERRSGIERRRVSYAAHIPERRGGTDRRVSDDRRRKSVGVASGSKLRKEVNGNELKSEK